MVNYDWDDDREEYSLYQIKDMFKHVGKSSKVDTTLEVAGSHAVQAVESHAVESPAVELCAHAATQPDVLAAVDNELIHVSQRQLLPNEREIIDLTTVSKSNKVAESLYSLILGQTKASSSDKFENSNGNITATFMNGGKKMKVIFVEDVEDDEV